MASPLFQSATTDAVNGTSRSTSLSVSALADRLLLLCIGVGPNSLGSCPAVSSVVFNTTENFTRIDRVVNAGNIRTEMWGLIAPTATTANAVVSVGGGLNANLSIAYLQIYNVDQSSPLTAKNTGVGTGNPSTTVGTSTDTDLVIDSLGISGTSITVVDAGQTIRAVKSITTSGTTTQVKSSTKAGSSGGVTMSWTALSGTPIWAQIVASIKSADTNLVLAPTLPMLGAGR